MLPLLLSVASNTAGEDTEPAARDRAARIVRDAAATREVDARPAGTGRTDAAAVGDRPCPSGSDIDANAAALDRCAGAVGDAATFGELDAAVFCTRNAAAVRDGAGGSGDEDAEVSRPRPTRSNCS